LFADFRQYCKKEHRPAIGSIIRLARELADLYHVEDAYIGKRKERKHVWKGIALISSLRPEEQTEILGEDKYE
jgi:hypothetical protein